MLGSSHTRGPDGYASGVRRTKGVVRLLDKHDVDVVGLQEMQADQMRSFHKRTGGAYAMYPGFSGEREIDGENSVAWDRSTWQALEKRAFTIPYFHGNRRTMPLVKLRNLRTGMTAWFANVHNPASTREHGGSAKWRAKAIRSEARLARRLHATGVPVFLTGDMNEREQAFCPLTGSAPLQAARGGSHTDGTCRANDPKYVDWAFGSSQLDLRRLRRGPRRHEPPHQRPPDRGQRRPHRRRHLLDRRPALTRSRSGAGILAACADGCRSRPGLAPTVLIGGWTLAASRQRGGFDAVRETISALAAHGADDRWLMTGALAVLGGAHVATAAGLEEAEPAGRVVLAVGGVTTALVAAFPQPSPGHFPAATASFVALAVWPALSGLPTGAAGRWATVGLLALLGWLTVELGGRELIGVSERVVAAAEALWPLAVVLAVRRASVRASV